MKADVLKKHHFWIVAGASLLMVLLTFFMLTDGVSEAIDAKQGEIKKASDAVKAVQAPGKSALAEIEEQKKVLEAKKDELWRENWENQKIYYVWPGRDDRDRMFTVYNDLKFGTPLTDFKEEKWGPFKRAEVYQRMYEKMAAVVAPTQFAGNWQAVLGERYIAKLEDRVPDSPKLWLAMEDAWVQRALLEPIGVVNRAAASFAVATPAAGQPPFTALKKTFIGSTWQVELEVAEQANVGKILKGKLKNITKQMQILGNNSTLTLRVWFRKESELASLDFKVEGEYVEGESYSGATKSDPAPFVPTLPGHGISPDVTELVKVEQILDERNVPIRQIDKITLNPVSVPLLPPEFWKIEAAAAPVAGGVAPPPSMPRFPGAEATTAVGKTIDQAVVQLRYLEVTGQLRRMPVAVKIVLDQRYMQDVMVAYTNSPMRLQIVQHSWKRFRGTLTVPPADGSSGGGTTVAGSSVSPPATIGQVSGEFNRRMERGGPPTAFPPPRGGGGNSADSAPAGGGNVSEGQANSSLIELTIYGIVTLYEKYEVKKDAAKPAGTPETPAAPPVEEPKTAKPAEAAPAPKGTVPPTTPPAPKL